MKDTKQVSEPKKIQVNRVFNSEYHYHILDQADQNTDVPDRRHEEKWEYQEWLADSGAYDYD